jgi:uncharacterized metal-binding protein/rhodanese-related sulfurtransferase
LSCTTCKSKECRTSAKDCFGIGELSLSIYGTPEVKETALAASRLIDNGRAGTLNRLEEIIEYCKDRGYKKIGVAYCFGLPDLARSLELELKKNDFIPFMVQCTAGGVLERDIDESKTKDTVSCNPVGQAHTLMNKGAEFVIEMGLCMGHDVIFHETLKLPFTTFLVKDRIFRHSPARALESYRPPETDFLESIDDSFRMKSPDFYINEKETGNALLIDVRKEEDYKAEHITDAICMPLNHIPELIRNFKTDRKTSLFFYCMGGIQAAYAAMYFFMNGYKNVYILSGGFSRWKKEERNTVKSQLLSSNY